MIGKLALLFFLYVTSCFLLTHAANADEFLNRCLSAKHHKFEPGPEAENFTHHCQQWKNHSCCTTETSKAIKDDGALSLYKMTWDHCSVQGKPSIQEACRKYFQKDMCFYECSPNIAPWIIVDTRSKKTRKERFQNIPLCSNDCDKWFEACKDDYTCSDNWNKNWEWANGTNNCIKECKTFKEYFHTSEKFCNQIYDYSFKYTEGELGKDCMTLWPKDKHEMKMNRQVGEKYALKALDAKGGAPSVLSQHLLIFLGLFSLVFGKLI